MDRAGIETMLMNYYRHMDRTKIQFDFLCNKKKPGAYDNEIRALGGRIYRTPGLNPVKYPQYLRYMRELFLREPGYKIVEGHNGMFAVYALHAAKVNGIPVRIAHSHNASLGLDWKLPLKLVCRRLLPEALTLRFSCGKAAAECMYGKTIVSEGGYELIPNAIETERFLFDSEIRSRLRAEYGLEDKHVVGHIGRFVLQKNHTFLLKVFSKLAESDDKARLVLLGDGARLERMKYKAAQLGIAEKVMFIGNVANANEWYQAFDCFVLTSLWEGLPVVGIEAQAADLPCVFSDRITREAALSGEVEFLSVKAPVERWTDALERAMSRTERKDNGKLIRDSGYDAALAAVKLQSRYLALAGEEPNMTKAGQRETEDENCDHRA